MNSSTVLKNNDGETDLQTILSAWNTATERLQRTHNALREEVGRLTDELEVKNRELARKNRLADLGQMASHVAHEVRNSLAPITLYLSLLRRRLNEDRGGLDVMDKVDVGFKALEATVNDLLQFTSDRAPRWGVFELRGLVEEVCDSLAPQMNAQGIDNELDVPRGMMLDGDRDMLRRALLNLTLNALDVMPKGGQLVVTSWQGASGTELEVADSGPGISEDVKKRLFEPFFTTKSGGTGLGLAIVHRIAEVHGGNVAVVNCPQGGAAFTICIPSRSMEAAA